MPLNYDFTDIDSWEELHRDSNQLAMSSMLALNMTNIGMRNVSDSNWKEVFRRIHILEHATYPSLQTHSTAPYAGDLYEPYYYKPQDINRRIGLKTNATVMSNDKFNRHVMRILSSNALRELTRWRDG